MTGIIVEKTNDEFRKRRDTNLQYAYKKDFRLSYSMFHHYWQNINKFKPPIVKTRVFPWNSIYALFPENVVLKIFNTWAKTYGKPKLKWKCERKLYIPLRFWVRNGSEITPNLLHVLNKIAQEKKI
jgi:hypothetical protein